MPPFLLKLPSIIMSFFSSIVSPIAKAIKYLILYKLVKGRIKGQIAEKNSRIKDEQLKVKAQPDKSRGNLIDRMRNNGF